MLGGGGPATACSTPHPVQLSSTQPRHGEPGCAAAPGPALGAVSVSHPPRGSGRFTTLSHCESDHTLPEQLPEAQSWRGDVTPAAASPAQHHVPRTNSAPVAGPLGLSTQPTALVTLCIWASGLHASIPRWVGALGRSLHAPLGAPVPAQPHTAQSCSQPGRSRGIPLPHTGCRRLCMVLPAPGLSVLLRGRGIALQPDTRWPGPHCHGAQDPAEL